MRHTALTMSETSLRKIRLLEEQLTYASPAECAKLTKKLVKLKTELACGKR